MGKATGFLEYSRRTVPDVPAKERMTNWKEFHCHLPLEEIKEQGARCMDCGVPFCQSGMMLAGMASGCPLHNLIPEWNDLVYHGNLKAAYERLHKTSSFPEFTSRVCPALCENACTCGLNGDPVATRENEYAIIENAFAEGYVKPEIPAARSGKSVAVVGSGPAGLACADLLNRRGHSVTVFERDDRLGGLLTYGIPNMKLSKDIVARRVRLMMEEGVTFKTGVDVGRDVTADELLKEFDRVVLCCGAKAARDLKVEGRDADGIYFAVDFLKANTKALLDSGALFDGEDAGLDGKPVSGAFSEKSADEGASEAAKASDAAAKASKACGPAGPVARGAVSAYGKHVVIVGGGDTGNDCVGTCMRHGAKSVLQIEMMPKAPDTRAESNPWPEWPKVCKTDYGQEEAIAVFGGDPRVYETTVKECIKDKKGHIRKITTVGLSWTKDPATGRMSMSEVAGSERTLPCDLLIIAAGFVGSEVYVTEGFGVERTQRGCVATAAGAYASSRERVFAAGDVRRGQSLVVWAIREGREAARDIDADLMGYTNILVQ